MRPKDISIHNAYRMTSYHFRTAEDVERFFTSKGGKRFEVLNFDEDNTGYNITMKQPLNKYSKIIPSSDVEVEFYHKPYVGNTTYLKQYMTRDSIKVNWTVNVWEYIVKSKEAYEKYRQRNLGKYIHIDSFEPFGYQQVLMRVIKRNTYGYRKYSYCFTLSDDEQEAYRQAHWNDYNW